MAYGEGIGGRIRFEVDWIYDAIAEDNGNYLYNIDIMTDALNKIASDADKIEEEKKKYAWHDLRKNPDDLPEEGKYYQCVLENHEYDADGYPSFEYSLEDEEFGLYKNIFDPVSLGFVDTVFDTMQDMGYEKVIAWREIEPFEK